MDYSFSYEDQHTEQHTHFFTTAYHRQVEHYPFLFICVVVTLVCFGLVTMYSASYNEAIRMNLPSHYFVLRQAVFALLGGIAFFVIRYIPFSLIKTVAIPLFLVSLLLMVLTVVTPLGITRMGARRWMQIGPLPSFQPSELLKVSAVMTLSLIASVPQKKRHRMISLALIGISVLAIFIQRDYSTSLVFLLVGLCFLLLAGLSITHMLFISCAMGIPAVLFLFLEPYRIKRIVSFLFPAIDPKGLNWQVQNAIGAIASGGILGKGLGEGTMKLDLIPEVQSDFIFASIAEETGLIGMGVVIGLFVLFGVCGFRLFRLHFESDRCKAYMAFGITFMILLQAIVHLAVVTALLPPTGIPLPFFSQGGTNLLVILCECGILYNIMVNKKSRKKEVGNG